MEGRVIFKSHVKPLLKGRAFIQPREDIKIKTDQSLNACPVTYVGVALRNRKLSNVQRHPNCNKVYNDCTVFGALPGRKL